MTEQAGLFSIPTRLLLTPEQRAKLEALVRERETSLAELVSAVLAEYLDAQGDLQPLPVEPADRDPELRQRRAELARLLARRAAVGAAAPAWLNSYIDALAGEVARLEGGR